MRHIVLSGLVALAAAGTLVACSGSGSGSGSGNGGAASTPAAAAQPAPAATSGSSTGGSTSMPSGTAVPGGASASGAAVLGTASSSLGTIVVDGAGMTAYVFDKDPAGAMTSACTGSCATLWPAIDAPSATPAVQGVSGTVGTIMGTDGHLQVTLDGHPLYTFVQDTATGDTKGQGYAGIWWVVGPDGAAIGH